MNTLNSDGLYPTVGDRSRHKNYLNEQVSFDLQLSAAGARGIDQTQPESILSHQLAMPGAGYV
ncbi:hypothetical protein LC605_12055 [Nostoc sp. CHAB 5836]|uniref:hypothetical protein n=1 Tax=Nostoc sp. CHAB 5836 TaxID=2780404 RepID=UPI001E373D93|nr:hypothetical protein [Nostoc sp. CHAB 5836]MCC5615788.1 hypothetical protein [Nostoc sp. CHAB 5836]